MNYDEQESFDARCRTDEIAPALERASTLLCVHRENAGSQRLRQDNEPALFYIVWQIPKSQACFLGNLLFFPEKNRGWSLEFWGLELHFKGWLEASVAEAGPLTFKVNSRISTFLPEPARLGVSVEAPPRSWLDFSYQLGWLAQGMDQLLNAYICCWHLRLWTGSEVARGKMCNRLPCAVEFFRREFMRIFPAELELSMAACVFFHHHVTFEIRSCRWSSAFCFASQAAAKKQLSQSWIAMSHVLVMCCFASACISFAGMLPRFKLSYLKRRPKFQISLGTKLESDKSFLELSELWHLDSSFQQFDIVIMAVSRSHPKPQGHNPYHVGLQLSVLCFDLSPWSIWMGRFASCTIGGYGMLWVHVWSAGQPEIKQVTKRYTKIPSCKLT